MDSSVFQNTREQNHKEPPKLASAHWQPVRDSPLVAKIALGIVEERGSKRRKTSLLVPLGSTATTPYAEAPWCTRKAGFRGAPELFLLCHSI